jgi:hypothetical protein
MRKVFLIHHIPGCKSWETCFRFLMEKSDTFRIIFQVESNAYDAEGLNAGKQEFLNLPSITISPYSGMKNSIEATGALDTAARELFLSFMKPAFEGHTPDLWSFQLLERNDVLLRVEDFTVALLFLGESDIAGLLAQGVDKTDLEEIDNFPV